MCGLSQGGEQYHRCLNQAATFVDGRSAVGDCSQLLPEKVPGTSQRLTATEEWGTLCGIGERNIELANRTLQENLKSMIKYHRLSTFRLGAFPPPNSAGSTVLNPLLRLVGRLSGECSSITSTISSSSSSTITLSSRGALDTLRSIRTSSFTRLRWVASTLPLLLDLLLLFRCVCFSMTSVFTTAARPVYVLMMSRMSHRTRIEPKTAPRVMPATAPGAGPALRPW